MQTDPLPDREPQSDIHIADLVTRIDDLPPLPSAVSRTLQTLSDPNASIKEIEAALGQDQAIVAKLIKVSNSALYGGFQKVGTLRQAVTRLGLKTIKSLILAVSTRGYFLKNRQGIAVWGHMLWQHAIECGMAARRIASATRYEDPDEAFIGGIMHDIGKLVMLLILPDSYKEVQKLYKMRRMDEKTAELQVIGADHEQIGRLLMNKWNMPEAVKICVEYHHRHAEAGRFEKLVSIIAYANFLSHQYGAHPQNLPDFDRHDGFSREWMDKLNLSDQQHNHLIETIVADFEGTEMMV